MSAVSGAIGAKTGELRAVREVPDAGRNENAVETVRTGVANFDPKQAKEAMERSGVVAGVDKVNAKEDVPHADAAWTWFRTKINSAKYWVAPMVDQSELAFRMLCKAHGAEAAYTPMLHARIFNENAAYREEHFTSTFDHPEKDRPLLAQFCANDPDILLDAARHVEPYVDGVDINLGCPQRIAKKGRYGSYLMNDVPLVESMVKKLAENLSVPVTVKIRRFPDLQETVEYAARLEKAGASLVAVHGRTREEKRAKSSMACWETIAAVKKALHVPVLANGNLRNIQDVHYCLDATGADGVMSAEALLEDPAMFSPRRLESAYSPIDGPTMLLEYCDMVDQYSTPGRMIKGHAFSLLNPWLAEFVDLRDELHQTRMTPASIRTFTERVIARIEEIERKESRRHPIPAVSKRRLEAMEREMAKEAAIAEQQRMESMETPDGVEVSDHRLVG
jgi:tRNA-dihydrouridine synthase 1